MVGLFDPLRAAPDDLALAGGLLGASKRQRRATRSCFGPCSAAALMHEDDAASSVLRAAGAAPGALVSALLCAACASDYATRAATAGCARCGDALRIDVPIEGHDVAGLCAPCAVGIAVAAAAQVAAALLLARLAEIEAGAARPNTASKAMGRDRRYPAFGCCGAGLGDGYDQHTVWLPRGEGSARPIAPAAMRLLRADSVTFKVAVGNPPSAYFYFQGGVVRGMALGMFDESVEIYSETLGLRFVVLLIEFFGAGNGVGSGYLPAAIRDGIDSSALCVDVPRPRWLHGRSLHGTPMVGCAVEDRPHWPSDRCRRQWLNVWCECYSLRTRYTKVCGSISVGTIFPQSFIRPSVRGRPRGARRKATCVMAFLNVPRTF